MHFYSSQHGFPIPKISLCKKRTNFLIIYYLHIVGLSLAFVSLIYSKLQTSDNCDSRKTHAFLGKNISHWWFNNLSLHRLNRYGYFKFLYLDNRLRYQDETKKDFSDTVSSIFSVSFDNQIFNFFSRNFRMKIFIHPCIVR